MQFFLLINYFLDKDNILHNINGMMDKVLLNKILDVKKSIDINVLYVEDNDNAQRETLELLNPFFHHIETANDGIDGLKKFRNGKFNFVITDINMPNMNGIDMIKEIKKIDKKMPIIIITAFNDYKYLTESIKIGVYGYILKPIDMNQLLESIYRVIEKIKLRRERDTVVSLLEQYKNIVDSSATVTKTDLLGNITYVNDQFCKISEYSKDELIGQPHNIVRHPDMPKKAFEDLWNTIQNKKIWHGLVKNKTKSGTAAYMKATIAPIMDENGEIIEYIAVRQNISEFMNQKKLLFDKINELEKPVLLMCKVEDYDDLENLYDAKTIEKLETNFFRKVMDLFPNYCKFEYGYNLGNGEFAFIQKSQGTTQINEFLEGIKEFQDKVAETIIEFEGYEYDVDVILSFACQKKNIIENARLGIKKAEEENINIVWADKIVEEIHNKAQKNIKTLKMIKDAIKDNRIISYFQPIYNNNTKTIEKYESLVRLIDDQGKVLTPFFFLDVAKLGKYYKQITSIVFENTVKAIKIHKKEISFNLSAIDMEDKHIRNRILERLRKEKEIANYLVVELLENEGIHQMNTVKQFIKELKSLGVKISIDDFGSGYSNFSRLIDYEPDYLKIDGSLIKNITNDTSSLHIVETIKNFADKEGYKIIAEFVADKNIFDMVNKLGIEYSQGYYLGKPEPFNI